MLQAYISKDWRVELYSKKGLSMGLVNKSTKKTPFVFGAGSGLEPKALRKVADALMKAMDDGALSEAKGKELAADLVQKAVDERAD